MNSHFCVFLLRLAGVYCITSKIESLDLNGIKRILNDQTVINEWNAAIDQKVIYEHPDGRKSTVKGKTNLLNFKKNADNSSAMELERIRNIIKLAYQCTLTKYASMAALLIIQNVLQLKTNIYEAIRFTRENISDFDPQTVFSNELFKSRLLLLNNGKAYLDFDAKLDFKPNGNFQFFNAHHDAKSKPDIYRFWASMIEKAFGLKILYEMYTDVMRTKFTNEYRQPLVDTVNELVCVLNEAIQILDNFVFNNCVQRIKRFSFVKNFQSLKNEVNGDFVSVLRQLDEMKTTDASLEVYKDFTKSIPGTLPEFAAMQASGCFVENLQIDVSGFKMDLPNTLNVSTDIYGQDFDERISEINMKVVESIKNEPQDEVKIGMILFHDEGNSSDDYSQSSEA